MRDDEHILVATVGVVDVVVVVVSECVCMSGCICDQNANEMEESVCVCLFVCVCLCVFVRERLDRERNCFSFFMKINPACFARRFVTACMSGC